MGRDRHFPVRVRSEFSHLFVAAHVPDFVVFEFFNCKFVVHIKLFPAEIIVSIRFTIREVLRKRRIVPTNRSEGRVKNELS